ncbi:MAG: glycosyltransferase [Candidatus Paceibacterota bacterium]
MESPKELSKPKVAIVHDFLTYWGGAEQVLLSLHHIYPDAPIYTLLYDKKMDEYFPNARIRVSFLGKLPNFLKKRKKFMLPLLPTAAETFDLSGFDLVISSSGSFAKGVIVKPRTLHVSYCHAPTRFLWDWYQNYLKENHVGKIKKLLVVPVLHLIRIWDRSASERVDFYVANSRNTALRIKKFYGRDSKVIYPPVDFKKFNEMKNLPSVPEKDYYLIVSRLSPYKKIDIAITAFNKMNLTLVIIGEGGDRKRLGKMAENNITFAGFQDEKHLAAYYEGAKAVIFPGEDDFGITIVEAMSFGKPVLAYARGGALETVTPGKTGELFASEVPEILADGVRRMSRNMEKYNTQEIKAFAEKFSRENFEKRFKEFVDEARRRE